jgi:PIN domain nuclease of toxin-antitoxin system
MILLDTSSLIWWVSRDPALSVTALARIEVERPGGDILVSAMAGWEVAELVAAGRLSLRMEPGAWLGRVAAVPGLRLVPVDAEIALHAACLPAPAPAGMVPRLLAATARKFGCAVVTRERELRAYRHIEVVW